MTTQTQCNRCISAGGGDCATCVPEEPLHGNKKEPVKVIINSRDGADSHFTDGPDMAWIRVLPACRYSDVGSRALTPAELNKAVEMWMISEHTKQMKKETLTTATEFIESSEGIEQVSIERETGQRAGKEGAINYLTGYETLTVRRKVR